MSTPVCSIHSKPMRLGPQRGNKPANFFCASKMPDGSWCPSNAPGPTLAATPANGAAPVAAAVAAPVSDPRVALAVAAMEMAGRVYSSSGPVGDEAARLMAVEVYRAMMAVAT